MLVFAILTLCSLLVIFLAAAFMLWKNPPSINVHLPAWKFPDIRVDMSKLIPSPLLVQIQAIAPEIAPVAKADELIPVDILGYIDEESDEWARSARRKRARALFAELRDWKLVFAQLQREDNPQ